MDKYPLLEREENVGELLVCQEAQTVLFQLDCSRQRGGLRRAFVVGTTGELRLGVLETKDNGLFLRRRFSRALAAPLGKILRGELRSIETEEQWGPLKDLGACFKSPILREGLRGRQGILLHCGTRRRMIAVPRDDNAPFPLEPLFCFATQRYLDGRAYWVFSFDEQEWPIF